VNNRGSAGFHQRSLRRALKPCRRQSYGIPRNVPVRGRLAKVTPVNGDDQKDTADRDRQARHDRSRGREPQLRDLRRCQPDSGEDEQQKPDFGDACARVIRETENEVHTVILLDRRARCPWGRRRRLAHGSDVMRETPGRFAAVMSGASGASRK
jgi:hypothetical protein